MSKQRVRSLIDSYEYGKLKKSKIIPKQTMFNKVQKKGGNFPKLSRKVSPSELGIFVDELCKKVINSQKFDRDCLSFIYNQMGLSCDIKYVLKCEDYFEDISGWILSHFPNGAETDAEWSNGNVVGHPDIVEGNTVYDIKMTGRFGAMRISTIFQLLSYYALARANELPITHIGLILPAQREVIRINVSDWNSDKFMELLQKTSTDVSERAPTYQDMFDLVQLQPYIGGHVGRESTLYSTVSKITTQQPIQFFLGTRCKPIHNYSDIDIAKTLEHVLRYNTSWFVHAPYTLNLSGYHNDDWIYTSMEKQLRSCSVAGGKGVVIHVGRKAKMSHQEAFDRMKTHIIRMGEVATPECPVLIETDSGGSVIDNPSDLAIFYLELPEEVKPNIAICHDTCHVFAAGYDNLETLMMFESRGVPVKLIHYNDSKKPFGSEKDEHAMIGRGLIGLGKLVEIAKYAVQKGIYMVRE